MKKLALMALVSAVTVVGTASSAFAQAGDSDIDALINGITGGNTSTNKNPPANPTPVTNNNTPGTSATDIINNPNYNSGSAEGLSLDSIKDTSANPVSSDGVTSDPMLEPEDPTATNTSSDGNAIELTTDSLVDDVTVQPDTKEVAKKHQVATPRKVTSNKRLSAAGMDTLTLVLAGLLVSGGIAFAVTRRKK